MTSGNDVKVWKRIRKRAMKLVP